MNAEFIGLEFDYNSGFYRHHKHENLLSIRDFRGLYNIPFHVGENSKQPFGICFLPYFKHPHVIHSVNSHCDTISQ